MEQRLIACVPSVDFMRHADGEVEVSVDVGGIASLWFPASELDNFIGQLVAVRQEILKGTTENMPE